MARAKRDSQEKGGKKAAAPAKLSKEMKADIEKMMEKRFSAIEKQLEKLKGSNSKGSNSKGDSRKASGTTKANKSTKAKQDNLAKTKKTGGRGKKKSNQKNEGAE